MSIRLPAVRPEKYDGLNTRELREELVKQDTKRVKSDFESQLTEFKGLRLGSAAGSALLTGMLYQKWPSLQSLMGTPASADHLLAVGGAIAAFTAKEEEIASASEGVASMAISHLLRAMGRKVLGAVI